MSKSIISNDKACFICGSPYVHLHHIYAGYNRKHSDQYGCTVYLCPYHHNLSNAGVHFNRELDLKLKKLCQEKFEELYSKEDFIKIFGKNYL